MISITYDQRNAQLDHIIKPLPLPSYTVDAGFSYIEHLLNGYRDDWGLNLEPDFQRGHIWTDDQRTSFIEGMLRGTIGDSLRTIQFNAPHWECDTLPGDLPHEIQIVDGLQRLTTIRRFLAGEVLAFGLSASDLAGSRYDVRRDSNRRLRFAIHNFQWRRDLLTYYLDINTGGTPHSAREIDRVRGLLTASVQGGAT